MKLQKVSPLNKELTGAVFGLYHSDGEHIGDYTSDQKGQVAVNKLSPGDYYFAEKKAPDGYEISSEKRKFTITSSKQGRPETLDLGKFVNEEVAKKTNIPTSMNKSKPSNKDSETTTGSYPKTNDTRNPWLLIAGIAVIIIAGTIYFRRRNK